MGISKSKCRSDERKHPLLRFNRDDGRRSFEKQVPLHSHSTFALRIIQALFPFYEPHPLSAAYLVHRIVPRCGKSRRISLRAPLLYKCRSASVHNNFTHSRRFTPYRVNFHPLRFFYTMLCNASGANLQNCRHPRFAHLLFPAIRCIMHICT